MDDDIETNASTFMREMKEVQHYNYIHSGRNYILQ